MSDTKIARDGYPEPKTKIGRWVASHSGPLCAATMAVSLAVIGTVAWTSDDSAPVDHTTQANLCQEEDGSDQEFCWWYDQGTGWIMNIHHGEWSYVQSTGDMIHYAHKGE